MDSRRRVLFVDDEPHVLEGIRRALVDVDDDWDMAFRTSGAEALALMAQQPFDVVVSDMRMPRMDGAQLLDAVRKTYPATIRIILSGWTEVAAVLRTIGPAHIYLAKPCDGDVLRTTIERQIALRSLLNTPGLRALLAGITTLPSLPDVFMRVQEELRSANASAKTIAEIISRDMAMTAELLKLTNSAYFSRASRISSPFQAVRLLGLETIQALVLSIGIFRQFSGNAVITPLLRSLTDNNMAIARLAEAIATAEGADQPIAKAAYCAAMLADIGNLVLLDTHSREYFAMLSQVSPERPLVAAEHEAFGADHGMIGAYLLGLWGFTSVVVEAIAYSLTPARCPTPDNVVLRALHAARTLGPPSPLLPPDCPDGCMAALDQLVTTWGAERVGQWRKLAERKRPGEK